MLNGPSVRDVFAPRGLFDAFERHQVCWTVSLWAPWAPFERHRCSFCMVFTWFSHMSYFQASFAERSLSLSQKNFVNWWKATKTILFDQILIEIAWPSKTIVNIMQIQPSEASLTLHIWRLGGLWGAYRALWERSWSVVECHESAPGHLTPL